MLVTLRRAGISLLALFAATGLATVLPGFGNAARADVPERAMEPAAPEQVTAFADPEGLLIAWPAGPQSGAPVEIERSSDGEAPRQIALVGDTGRHVDRTAAINRFYEYRVRRAGRELGVASGIRSDIRRPFVCPPLAPVPDHQLGVDRTETFDTPAGRRVTVTVRAPRPKSAVRRVARCDSRPGCSDLGAIEQAIADVIVNSRCATVSGNRTPGNAHGVAITQHTSK